MLSADLGRYGYSKSSVVLWCPMREILKWEKGKKGRFKSLKNGQKIVLGDKIEDLL